VVASRVTHFEVPYDDGDRARAFYRDIFGWEITDVPEMDYTMATTGPTGETGMPSEPGHINGGLFARNDIYPRSPVVTIEVDSIDDTLKAVESSGGATVVAKEQVGEMGFSAYFRDSEGNVLGLWENPAQG
jgi:predicted enzyme related to lactoylglutathione lyase